MCDVKDDDSGSAAIKIKDEKLKFIIAYGYGY
jgi:hypothetical protein